MFRSGLTGARCVVSCDSDGMGSDGGLRWRWRWRLPAALVAGALLMVAASALPWASYRIGSLPAHRLGAGMFGLGLGALGVIGVLLVAAAGRRPFRALVYAEISVGVLAAALSIVIAGARIAHANSVTTASARPTSTSFGLGMPVGLLASAVLVVVAILDLSWPTEAH